MSECLPISFPMGKSWYCVYSEIRKETKVAAELGSLGFESYLPMGKCRKHRRGEGRGWMLAFPRYLFVRFDINKDDWGQIKDIWGVQDLIRFDGIPVKIRDETVDEMRRLQDIGFYDERGPIQIRPGEMIRAVSGPFAERVGKFMRATRKGRIEVLFGILKSELTLDSVVKAN